MWEKKPDVIFPHVREKIRQVCEYVKHETSREQNRWDEKILDKNKKSLEEKVSVYDKVYEMRRILETRVNTVRN